MGGDLVKRTLEFPRHERVVDFFEDTYREAPGDAMAVAAVLQLVRSGGLSSGKAAELLGMSRWDLADLLAEHDVPSIDLTMEELAEEEATLRRVLGDPAA